MSERRRKQSERIWKKSLEEDEAIDRVETIFVLIVFAVVVLCSAAVIFFIHGIAVALGGMQ